MGRMTYLMEPKTAAGRRFIEAASELAPVFRKRAAQADADATMAVDNFRDMRASGVAAAFVPEALGGFGLDSVHDWIAGIAALARGDASTAIAINMHLAVSRGLAAAYTAAASAGKRPEALAAPLRAIVADDMLICATATERGTDNLHPLTEATRADDGWRIDGTKLFVTMSPIATHIGMNVRMRDEQGDHIATTMLPIDTPGIEPQNDWDALGMRASGSQSIRLDNVRVASGGVRPIGPWGRWSVAFLTNRTLANLPLVGAFLGIAESARDMALESLARQQRLGAPVNALAGVQHVVGEMEIELASCQAILGRAGDIMDRYVERTRAAPASLVDAHEIMKDYQSAKWVVNRGAIDIVSKAMDCAGGAGFMAANPLTRLYRDVRAGPFMQPYAPTEAREYVGRVALGLAPDA